MNALTASVLIAFGLAAAALAAFLIGRRRGRTAAPGTPATMDQRIRLRAAAARAGAPGGAIDADDPALSAKAADAWMDRLTPGGAR